MVVEGLITVESWPQSVFFRESKNTFLGYVFVMVLVKVAIYEGLFCSGVLG